MADLLFSFNAVAPLFLVMLLGFILKRKNFIDDDFVETGTKLCFNVTLPCLLFLNIVHSDLTESFDVKLIVLCVGGSVAAVALMRLVVPYFIRDKATSSAFMQVCFRSNYALLGLPFIKNVAGPESLAMASTMLAFIIPTFNVLAVLLLAENQGQGQTGHILVKRITTNPLIIAAALGIAFSILPFPLPEVLETPASYIADMAMPLALFTIGGSIKFSGERNKLSLALWASFIKLIALPMAAVAIAIAWHFNTVQICIVLGLFAGPPAVSCFPMAFQMGADHNFTSLAVIMGTALSGISMFFFVYMLRVMGVL